MSRDGTTCKCCRLLTPGRRFHSRDVPPPLEDVRALFSLHAGGAPHMDEDGLRRCLGYDDTDDDVDYGEMLRRRPRSYISSALQRRCRTGGTSPTPPRQQLFTLVDFHRILFSHDLNPAIRQQRVHHDMTLPLSHYFIYSSGGYKSIIIRELLMGVRAIEVAMRPNSEKDDINILHRGFYGGTPPSRTLAECLKSIKEHAFVASPYPVIITLEDELESSDLQKKAAKVMLDVLGDILYWPHTDHVDVRGNTDRNNPLEELPSPEALKGRVLLSTKPPSLSKKTKPGPSRFRRSIIEQGEAAILLDGGDEDQKMQPPPYGHLIAVKQVAIEGVYGGRPPWEGVIVLSPIILRRRRGRHETIETIEGPPTLPRRGGLKTTERVSILENEPVPLQSEPAPAVLRRGGIKTSETVERVTTLSEPVPRPRWCRANQTEGIANVAHVDALRSEPSKQQIEKTAKDRSTDIVRFTQRNILRISPFRNYEAFIGWVHGAQMVAMNISLLEEMVARNMQKRDERDLWVMHGFYRANGGCGYVRKPDFLMQTEPAEVYDDGNPWRWRPVKRTLKVKVYMGDGWLMDFKHTHTSFIPNFWASVGIAGVPGDTTIVGVVLEDANAMNTKATENTWVPVWEDEFSFPLRVPEIALLLVEVHQYDVSEKDVFGGQTVLPVSELRPGIRAVALFDRLGNRLPNVKLLMRFEFV